MTVVETVFVDGGLWPTAVLPPVVLLPAMAPLPTVVLVAVPLLALTAGAGLCGDNLSESLAWKPGISSSCGRR